jgi:DNA polymerase-3 subunit epsilon
VALSFVAIDFEKANQASHSACAVGVARVEDGAIVDQDHWLIDPPGGRSFFWACVKVHGITKDDVVGAPDWQQTRDRLSDFSSGLPFVAYGATDKNVYRAANEFCGLPDVGHEFLDALACARRRLQGESRPPDNYSLTSVATYLGIPPFVAHDAGADALACAEVVMKLADRYGAASLGALWPAATIGETPKMPVAGELVTGPSACADPDHPLFGSEICFTGTLRILRREAKEMAARCGATTSASGYPTKTTRFMVVGDVDPSKLRSGHGNTNKLDRALELISQGFDIEFVDEAGFFRLIGLGAGDLQ